MGAMMQIAQLAIQAGSVEADITAKNSAGVRNMNELERSAQLEEVNAVDALRQGEQDAGRARMKGSEMVARQRVAFSNSGVDASVGTPAQVAASTSMWTELDAQTSRNNAMRKAFGYKQSARKYRTESSSIQDQLNAEQVAGALKLGTAMMNTVSDAMKNGGG